MGQPFKLSIELIPSTSWYNNLRSVVSREQWDVLRKKVYMDYKYKCGICNSGGRLSCHEIWSYDDEKHVQKLSGFIALCELCHRVKHIGLAQLDASKGLLDFENVVTHFMRVNNCDRKIFESHQKHAFEIWEKRSQQQWTVDIEGYKLGND